MPTLAEYLKEKAARLKAEQPQREHLIQDWTTAVEGLLTQVEAWLKEANHDGVLSFSRTPHQFNDEGMGMYTAPGLEVSTADGVRISLVPVGRKIVSAVALRGEAAPRRPEGRVDLRKWGDTIYSLYRFRENGQDQWFVAHPVWDTKRQCQIINPLTREEFERDFVSLLE